MLALKKKRAAEAKEKAEADAAAAMIETEQVSEPSSGAGKVSLLGVGGKKKKDSGENGKQNGKRRTPGELRIQKGE